MIQSLASKWQKKISFLLLFIFYCEIVIAGFNLVRVPSVYHGNKMDQVIDKEKVRRSGWELNPAEESTIPGNGGQSGFTYPNHENEGADNLKSVNVDAGGGPTQPEMQTFQSVNSSNMVDLFTGDFSYNIPLMDVGGYPVNISYRSGITMDQEASWVGLGWNINPGTVTRNMRGLPDDFAGGFDTIKKTTSIKAEKTIGVTGGANIELAGLPIGLGASLGIFHNNYRGWGIETALDASINAGVSSKGILTSGLSINNNSQEGLSIAPSLSYSVSEREADSKVSGNLSLSLPYNSRTGLKALQISAGIRQYALDDKNQKYSVGSRFNTSISFAYPAYTPSISLPYTNRQFTFTGKVGTAKKPLHPSFFISGYVTTNRIDPGDTTLSLPAYGYLNYQEAKDVNVLLDFNREKEIPYREKPAVPHIAIPSYTYDVFSITGEGTGGMFRAYRGDIGFIHDHNMKTKDESASMSVDLGWLDLVHGGVDLNLNRSFTQTGPWLNENLINRSISFKNSEGAFEAAYFRNPGEKSINSREFYENIGGDDVVTVALAQNNSSSPSIRATNILNRYRNKSFVGTAALTPATAYKNQRDKRGQVISYLNAREASEAGMSRYIENYSLNQYNIENCNTATPDDIEGDGVGLKGEYFNNENFLGVPVTRTDRVIDFSWNRQTLPAGINTERFAIRWTGRIKAPVTGAYTIYTKTDDGVRLWLNDSLLIDDWHLYPEKKNERTVNLVEGQFYKIKFEYKQHEGHASARLLWSYQGEPQQPIPTQYLFKASNIDVLKLNDALSIEKRVNKFRQPNHISEINVLNTDGRRYVYGIPVYNLKQKETSFSVDAHMGSDKDGLVKYVKGSDNTPQNKKGKDNYYNSEETPGYAHSFLLTGILSPDYVDLTGDGITDDDAGDAIKFNYSKIYGIGNPYQWRAPYVTDSATYNMGFKTYDRDDRGNYVYGEKEIWYLNSIYSKSMVATFKLGSRKDLLAIDENGKKTEVNHQVKKLEEINLYTKADFLKHGLNAVPIKTVHFEYTYELCRGINRPLNDSGKLTLKRIWFTYNDNDKGKLNPYVFNYHHNNPGYNIRSYDKWGNYKDPLQNPGSSPTNLINNAEYPYALQDSLPAAENAAAWTMNAIKLPSGGTIKVDYESDDYAYVQNKRAMQMFKVAGFSSYRPTGLNDLSDRLYGASDNLFIAVKVTDQVSNRKDAFDKYLEGLDKIYFRLSVRMPGDKYGSGFEYVPCYGGIDLGDDNAYGIINPTTIWIKLKGINLAGDKETGDYSPLAKTAIQFLRLNLPSQAYPGSEVGDDLDNGEAVKIIFSLADNIQDAFKSFDLTARMNGWATKTDLSRTLIRLNNPGYKRFGGGLRVKRIVIYDNWDAMTRGQKQQATYGQEYEYTRIKEINGKPQKISSGVASYEPILGGEENPFHQPIEYITKIAALAPVTLGYTEEPLGESFFPSAGIGYSKVRVRSIHTGNKKSANGYEETEFYTAYDFPTMTDRSMLSPENKKRFKPSIANFLRLNARNFLSISQGFKVELNDMHGKLKSQATYPEDDHENPISYTYNFYKVENPHTQVKQLSNTVWVINEKGEIDTAGVIGKDVEIMMDMRQQLSITNGNNFNVNGDLFTIPFVPPFFLLPSFLGLAQREETRFRSVATTKVIQRYGILDSVLHIEKGSKISTKNMLYDSETGDVLLTRTQNEYNDPVYNFSYPSHWAYEGMGGAYRNIDVVLNHLTIREGKITGGLPPGTTDTTFFASGDELLIISRQQTGGTDCNEEIASFPNYWKLWAVDANIIAGGPKQIFFLNADGVPFTGYDISLKIIRSGRKNINVPVGSVTSLNNPLVINESQNYELAIGSGSGVVSASATEYKQLWKVGDRYKSAEVKNCVLEPLPDCIERRSVNSSSPCTCDCLKSLFDYLSAYKRLFIKASDNILVNDLIQDAQNAGYGINSCPVLSYNAYKPFYALTFDSVGYVYRAKIGDCFVSWRSTKDTAVSFYRLISNECSERGKIYYSNQGNTNNPADTLSITIPANFSMNVSSYMDSDFQTVYEKDAGSDKLITEGGFYHNDTIKNVSALLKFDGLTSVMNNATIISAELNLKADLRGHSPVLDTAAHSISPPQLGWLNVDMLRTAYWDYSTQVESFLYDYDYRNTIAVIKTNTFENFNIDVTGFIQDYALGNNQSKSFKLSEQYIHENDKYSTFYSNQYADSSQRPTLTIRYIIPADTAAVLQVDSCVKCEIVNAGLCYSAITDTIVNPYVYGILGNFREFKSYTYYGNRAESDPSLPVNIRFDGTIADFAPFWQFQDASFAAVYDTTRWVWNSEKTLFNLKGFELENKDPLGRYNAGLYGYNNTMPTAVIQNSQYRESAFEGFEDYEINSNSCDLACPAPRQFDFSGFRSNLDNTQKHTGKYSLRVDGGNSITMAANIAAPDNPADLSITTAYSTCQPDIPVLRSIKAADPLLPVYSPLAGSRIVLSAWVKEEKDCHCESYTDNQIQIVVNGDGDSYTEITARPSGNIIEGWQRYEQVIDLPQDALSISFALMATNGYAVYFDDIRIHPYQSNMKSFVYDPVNFRLMAQLDENNYATFYEYDDDGTLIRVKKETERGILTIKETRSALLKETE